MIDKTVAINNNIDFIVVETNNKNAYLRVDSSGRIVLSAPRHMAKRKLNNFVNDNIEKMVAAAIKMHNSKPYSLEKGWVMLHGRKHDFDFFPGRGYTFVGDKLILKGKNIELAFKNFIKKYSKTIIDQAQSLAEINGVSPVFSVKDMKSRWGVCYPQKNIINLSSRLIHYPLSAIEYVIIHEIVHLFVPNHSKQFWNEVEKRCPDYKDIKKILKRW